MFIYSATLTAKPGKQQPAMAQIVEVREIVEGVTGRPTSAWAAVTGQPIGTFAISVRVDSIADLIDGQQKLGASVEYAALSESSSDTWAQPAQTSMTRVIGAAGDTGAGSIISMTSAVISESYGEAIAFGHEVLEHVTASAGSPGMLMLSEAPSVGQLTWVFANESAEAAAEADSALQADEAYLGLYDRASSLFVPGHATRMMAARLG